MLYDVSDDAVPDHVLVKDTRVGKGVFAVRGYPFSAVVGEIRGNVISSREYGTDYSFELDETSQLEPFEPFRYLNHSCDPNCEFDWMEEPGIEGEPAKHRLYLSTLRDIEVGEELTIEYNWPATYAIRCDCRSPLCRGWVVAPEELANVMLDLDEV